MAPRSCAWQNPNDNLLTNPNKEKDKLAGLQSLVEKLDTGSNKTFTLPEALTSPLIPPIKNVKTVNLVL